MDKDFDGMFAELDPAQVAEVIGNLEFLIAQNKAMVDGFDNRQISSSTDWYSAKADFGSRISAFDAAMTNFNSKYPLALVYDDTRCRVFTALYSGPEKLSCSRKLNSNVLAGTYLQFFEDVLGRIQGWDSIQTVQHGRAAARGDKDKLQRLLVEENVSPDSQISLCEKGKIMISTRRFSGTEGFWVQDVGNNMELCRLGIAEKVFVYYALRQPYDSSITVSTAVCHK